MQKHEDDKILILKAKKGDNSAFGELVKKYERGIKSRIIKSGVSRDDLEEVFQEATIYLWKKIDSYDFEKGAFYSYYAVSAKFMVERYFDAKKKSDVRASPLRQNAEYAMKDTLLYQQGNSKRVEKDSSRNDSENDYAHSEKKSDINGKSSENKVLSTLKKLITLHNSSSIFIRSAEEHYIDRHYDKDIYDDAIEALPHTGKPHQVISFMFNKIIYSEKPIKKDDEVKKAKKSGSPNKIVKELSNDILDTLFDTVKVEFIRRSAIPAELIHTYLQPLGNNLDKEEKCIRIGNKKLEDYYSGNPEANISDWSYRVRKKLVEILQKKGYDLHNKRNWAIKVKV